MSGAYSEATWLNNGSSVLRFTIIYEAFPLLWLQKLVQNIYKMTAEMYCM